MTPPRPEREAQTPRNMARKKNPHPTKRVCSTYSNNSGEPIDSSAAKRRRVEGGKTTTVIPAENDSSNILERIKQFAREFELKVFHDLRKEYKDAIKSNMLDQNGWYRGCRMITGNRYELKVLGDFVRERFDSFPEQLVHYAQCQAKKDERVQQMMSCASFTFSEWSMIVSDDCNAQSIHIDVPETNVQFGLILTDYDCPGTRVVLDENLGPYSLEQLFACWSDAPDALKNCIASQPQIKTRILKILNAYGPLLRPRQELERKMVGAETLAASSLKCGDVICTSGGIPHAGPACSHFRAVMFAAASPSSKQLYNVDDQYFAHSAVLMVIQAVWDTMDDDKTPVKAWLLRRLSNAVHDYDSRLVEHHCYVSTLLKDFMHQVAVEAFKNRTALDKQVEAIIAKFLDDHGSKSERELFQYRPPGLYDDE
jgi:hypothetical protein